MSGHPASFFWDCCAMVGPWHRAVLRFEDVPGLLREMRGMAIRKALVFHSVAWLHDFSAGNALLEEALAGQAELVPCHAVIPFTTGEMPPPGAWDARLAQGAPLAWRIFPRSHNFMLGGPGAERLFGFASERRIPVFVDIDEVELGELCPILRAHPALRLVLGNAGTSSFHGIYREFRKIFELLDMHEELRIEISFLIGFRGIEEIVRRWGNRRLLFGSRMPFLEPGSVVARLQYAEIGRGDFEAIAHGNLQALLAEVAA